jgi:hypothetical protein
MRISNFPFRMLLVVTITLLIAAFIPLTVHGQVTAENSCTDPNFANQLNMVHRMWSGSMVDHFYTQNANEMPSGYMAEQNTWSVLASQVTGSVPLYRYYSSAMTDHFYSTSASAPAGYMSEGMIGFVFPSGVPGSVPLYRMYKNGDHLYTASNMELNDASGKYGYMPEGIEGYVCPMPDMVQ